MAAGAAEATVYSITIPGVVTQANGVGPLQVGNAITLTTQFDDSNYVVWGNSGYYVMAAYSAASGSPLTALGTSGVNFWRIDTPGYVFSAVPAQGLGANPAFFVGGPGGRDLAGPAIVFTDAGVFGLANINSQTFFSGFPGLQDGPVLPGATGVSTPGNFKVINTGASNVLTITSSFEGSQSGQAVWNFGAATVRAVPEPATWAMLIVGFALVGASLRRRGSRGLASS